MDARAPGDDPGPASVSPPATPDPTPYSIRVPVSSRDVALTAIAVLAMVAALHFGQAFFIPIALGILISFALGPIVAALVRWKVPRVIAAGLVMAMALGTLGSLAYSLGDEAAAIVRELPQAAQKLRRSLRAGRGRDSSIEKVQAAAAELERAASEATARPAPPPPGVTRVQVEQPPLNLREYLWWGSVGAVTLTGQLAILMFLVFFLLASGDLYKRKLVKIAGPSLTKKKVTLQILDEINAQIERFLLVQLFASALVGLVSWVVFSSFGLEQAAVWALAAALFNSIPYLGPVAVTVGVFFVGFVQFEEIPRAALVAASALAVTSLEGFLLTPWLSGRAAQMNAVAIFVGLLFWSFVWGVWGALLAVPMMMIVKAVADRIEGLKPIGELLGD